MGFKILDIFVNARRGFAKFVISLMVCVTLFGFTAPSQAFCFLCAVAIRAIDSTTWKDAEDEFDDLLDDEFIELEEFIVHEMWEQSILPAMMLAAEQFTAVAIQQVMAIGMFIDAESQMDAQRLLQEIRAQVHKDYQPSVGMCEFGSVMKSIAATERRGEVTAVILAQRSQDRQLGQQDTSGTYGNDLDHDVRIMHFKTLFCNEHDRGSVLSSVCSDLAWTNASFDADARVRMNKDIDYFSLVDSPWTLTLDFTNEDIIDDSATINPKIHNEDEEHLLAMASNLYAHKTFPRVPARLLVNEIDKDLTTMQKAYMDMRAIVAKRSVAENSFYAIAVMKAEGNRLPPPTGATTPPDSFPMSARVYMQSILTELGVPAADTLRLLGDNPSYYAQMEILTKKLYQNPDFYTNLYDKPANVERKTVALQAIKLMQKFDVLKSSLRSEVSTSILLELAVMDLQGEIEDQIQAIDVSDK
ncbi:MAG: hypothetical protein COA45_06135 [Zetaproteobacteria bacterium]|nr:MAG: hypothetical protein COA45_06135 [Zetaproteobacteria bacterium]